MAADSVATKGLHRRFRTATHGYFRIFIYGSRLFLLKKSYFFHEKTD